MTIGQLRAAIKDLPDNMDVMLAQTNDEFYYGQVEQAHVRPVTFKAPEIPKKDWAEVDCLVITDQK